MQRQKAQKWADANGYQTLTTAMGSLRTLETSKRRKKRSKFMKGASAIFSWFISQGDWVGILLPLPPNQFHPSGSTSLQDFEIPIVKGLLRGGSVQTIDVFHLDASTEDARTSPHQLWPRDETRSWIQRFGAGTKASSWRAVKPGVGSLGQALRKLPHRSGGTTPNAPKMMQITSQSSRANSHSQPAKKKNKKKKKKENKGPGESNQKQRSGS
ncbi:hypothetical protein CSHISOI_10389 [Colletotrichum shisoi]|uniref:Uncharacterized protein n=1 Tax=Colletotrichum shisoi TaxID=2078593 RepID=A0A5Q4BDJ9_9PEZI|nr:hypothetical protein CSHISOI_10389 [Colletotrichum shisoi]